MLKKIHMKNIIVLIKDVATKVDTKIIIIMETIKISTT